MKVDQFFRRLTGVALAGMALTGVAQAGTVSYDFNGANNNALGMVHSTGPVGYGISVSGFSSLGGGAWTATNVSRAANALGVNNGKGGNPGQVDTNGDYVEGLLFDFGNLNFVSLTIQLGSFRNTGNNPENIDVWIGDSFDGSSVGSPLATQLYDNATPGNPFTINFSSRYLFIAASDNAPNQSINCSGNDSNCFRVDNINAVPEPGSLALVGLGLLAAVRLRRRI